MQKSSVEATQSPNLDAYSCFCIARGDISAAEDRRYRAAMFVRFIKEEGAQWPVLTAAGKGFWEYLRNSLDWVH